MKRYYRSTQSGQVLPPSNAVHVYADNGGYYERKRFQIEDVKTGRVLPAAHPVATLSRAEFRELLVWVNAPLTLERTPADDLADAQ